MTNPNATAQADEFAPTPPSTLERSFFGVVVNVDTYDCVFVQDASGKYNLVVFDPGIHDATQKRKKIKISIECRSKDGSAYYVDQDVTNNSDEWRTTYPSIGAIGKTVTTLNGSYVQVKRVTTGKKYQQKSTGEWKDKTALKFVALYPDFDAMQTAADAFYNKVSSDVAPPASNPAPQAAVVSPERTQAASFLELIWKASGGSVTKFLGDIASNPILAQHFNPQSPEVVKYTDGIPF